MKKSVCLLLIVSILLAGCAGRDPNPVKVYLPGDEDRSCESLRQEITDLKWDMAKLKPNAVDAKKNTRLLIAGLFFIVPFFFIDFKGADKIEYNALSNRIDILQKYANEKCGETKTVSESPNEGIKEIGLQNVIK